MIGTCLGAVVLFGNAYHNFSSYIFVNDKCYGKNIAKKGTVWRHG